MPRDVDVDIVAARAVAAAFIQLRRRCALLRSFYAFRRLAGAIYAPP